MNLHPDVWITDDTHPKKAGRYFTVTDGIISITSYSKKTYWGGVDVHGFYPTSLSGAFGKLGKELMVKRDAELANADTIIIVGDDGKPLKFPK